MPSLDSLDGLPVSGLGARPIGGTIAFKFTTDLDGFPSSLAGSPAVGAYKAGTTTPITAGVTLTTDYNSTVGLQDVSIVATVGNGFAAGSDYVVVVTAGTLGGVSMVGAPVGRFSLV
jgi:hypothetical protein